VDDRLTVRVGHGLGDIDEMGQQLEPLPQRPALGQRSLEGPAPHELLGRVERPVRPLRELVDGGDARMIQLRGEPRLPEEARPGGGRASGGALRSRRGHLLQRHLPTHEAVERAPDDRLSTAPQLLDAGVLSLPLRGDLRALRRNRWRRGLARLRRAQRA
jgi:hypothetical protein